MDFVFITSNQGKADHLAKWLDMPIKRHDIDLDEPQTLDLLAIAEHKARQGYEILKQPVLVEDVALTFTAMGRLPGTFVKWFLKEIDNEGLCKLADALPHRKAMASICYALYDGRGLHLFESHVSGVIAPTPRGEHGFGWNPIFQPDGSSKTYGEMTDEEVRPFSVRAQAIEKLKHHLQTSATTSV